MWQPLLKMLSVFGRIGPPAFRHRTRFAVGNPMAPDSAGGAEWKEFANTRRLWETWGPLQGSPWEPFHCVTLFAALDHLSGRLRPGLGPLAADAPAALGEGAALPEWTRGRDVMVVLDLPGPRVVAAGHALARRGGFQPVCTFDNWPNARGVIKSEQILGALLYYAADMSRCREGMAVSAPPVWLCDAGRCRGSKPSPGLYDNRYIIEDRLLPGPAMLLGAGIRRVVYARDEALPIRAFWDLDPYLDELKKKGLDVLAVSTASVAAFAAPGELVPGKPATLRLLAGGLIRSSAGGFGGFVPQPSSGG